MFPIDHLMKFIWTDQHSNVKRKSQPFHLQLRAVYLNLLLSLHLDVAPRNEMDIYQLTRIYNLENQLLKNKDNVDQFHNHNKESSYKKVIMEIVNDQLTSDSIHTLMEKCFAYLQRKLSTEFQKDPLFLIILHTLHLMLKFGFYTDEDCVQSE